MSKEDELRKFRQNNLQFYLDLVKNQSFYTKDLTELKMLKKRAKILKKEIEELELITSDKEQKLDLTLDRIDYLRRNNK